MKHASIALGADARERSNSSPSRIAFVALLGLLSLAAVETVDAQGRGRGNNDRGRDAQGIPPGHLPPPGECRVWYDNRPPGQQPRPTSCANARATATRNGGRVIYGDDSRRDARIDEDRRRDDDRRAEDRRADERRADARRDDRRRDCKEKDRRKGKCGYARDRDDARYPDQRYPDQRYPDQRYPDGGATGTTVVAIPMTRIRARCRRWCGASSTAVARAPMPFGSGWARRTCG